MNKYINAKELLNEVWTESVEGRIFDDNTYVGTFNVVPIGDITEIVNQMPSADVVEVKHGEWVHREDMDFIDQNGVEHFHLMCKNCGFVHDFLDCHTEQYNFCPDCGADMKGGVDNG